MKLTFSIKEAVLAGWRIFKSRPWLFIGSSFVYLAAQFVLGMIEKMLPGILSSLVSVVLGTLLSLGLVSFYLEAHDNVAGTTLKALWNPKPFLQYLATSLFIAALVMVGIVLLVVPGIILAIALSFSLYLVIEKRIWSVAAIKESMRITRGNRVTLFLLALVLAVMNVIGAGLILVGLFVTVPVSMLASVHVYRMLAARTSSVPVEAPVIAAPVV